MLKLLEDGSFELEVDGKRARGLIRSVATVDDIIRAVSLDYSVVIAEMFLPEAAEEAKKRGVQLVNIDDLASLIAEFLINALANRRFDLLARLFDYLIPPGMLREYTYFEIPTLERNMVQSIHFKATFIMLKNIRSVEGVDVLLMRISSKLVRKGIGVSFKTGIGKYNMWSMEIEFSINTET